MKISTRGRYALRLMMDIAINGQEEPVRIKDIARRQEISEKYLEQIVSVLNKAGFVKSSRGPQGGYRLMRAPAEYTAGSILCLIEGSLAPVACMDMDENDCPRHERCATLFLWQRLHEAMKDIIENVSLADLVAWQQELDAKLL
ncbi:RrF2 family transcriptional regulator [Selenomonas sp.]|uniref:RrF2 family transcriptional regulator n=1 Tax=Selenomonas sp. TaxID=2053611 RepID=UPI003FA21CCD